ncbi:cAMP-dependent protein kinase catalytic subunit alpha-like [Achlya hypogyna]|uniref:cAMP-dependent protein kinase catalytic subunit alpha-like n=1 Tax=Achlya hypogyna TaxID=1202772 RepID=A0A1V9YX50_ACHHY|nr:cAMP-dependent protein kinase catalytic subunit alpha-like [Achlya hypogyna]
MTSLVMPYIPGEPLYKCIWNATAFSESFAKACTVQIALAITSVHARGFMHRDLKSGNILLTRDGRCHLVDFGFAKATGGRAMTLCGTHYAMAPEVFGRLGYDTAVDWWALGVLIYEMVVGSPPWSYKSDGMALADYFATIVGTAAALPWPAKCSLSPELKDLVAGLLQVDPLKRFGSAALKHRWFADVDWLVPVVASGPELITGFKHLDVAGVDSADSITSTENALFAGF